MDEGTKRSKERERECSGVRDFVPPFTKNDFANLDAGHRSLVRTEYGFSTIEND